MIPNLWGAIVGQPGFLKTPAVEEVLRPLKRLEADAREKHAKHVAEWEERCMIAAAKKGAAKKALEKGANQKLDDSKLSELARAAMGDSEEDPPTVKRYLVNDATMEKLGELLSENPDGLTVFRDELTGFLRTLDRQGHEGDRGFYLESWNGSGGYTFDRIGRGTTYIPNMCLALFGTIQPGPLAKYLRGSISGEEADGFVPRFQILVYPDPSKQFVNVDRWPDTEAKNAAYGIFKAIDELDPAAIGCETDDDAGIPYVRFSEDAQVFFDEWRTELEVRLRSGSLSNVMACHLAKYRSLMPALALIFHLVNAKGQPRGSKVSLSDAESSAAWCDFMESHARRVYQAATDGDPTDAIRLAEKIKESLSNPFKIGDVQRKGWAGLGTNEEVRKAIGILEDRGWVRVVEVPIRRSYGRGRPSEQVWVNPKVTNGVTP